MIGVNLCFTQKFHGPTSMSNTEIISLISIRVSERKHSEGMISFYLFSIDLYYGSKKTSGGGTCNAVLLKFSDELLLSSLSLKVVERFSYSECDRCEPGTEL